MLNLELATNTSKDRDIIKEIIMEEIYSTKEGTTKTFMAMDDHNIVKVMVDHNIIKVMVEHNIIRIEVAIVIITREEQ